MYVNGIPTSDFSFTQTNPKYGIIKKQGVTLKLRANTPNKIESEIKIKTNDSQYTMIIKWKN